MRWAAFAVVLVGCGNPSVAPDMSSSDMANSGSCAGSAIAGTCLEQFFTMVSGCFQPSGSCVTQTAPSTSNTCWSNGAKLATTGGIVAGMGFTYTTSGQLCFYGSWSFTSGTQKSYTLTIDGNALLVYNRSTGETTCLDGTHPTLAPDFGGCAALQALIDLMPTGCSAGSC